MQEGVEVSAKTVDEAIDKGLAQLGLARDQVRVETLAAGKPGLFGIGGEDARVRLIPLAGGARAKTREEAVGLESAAEAAYAIEAEGGERAPAPLKGLDAPEVARAAQHLRDLVRLLEIDADVRVRAPETPGDGKGRASAVFDITGDDLALLIGRRGATLAAIQYLVNVVANRQGEGKILISLDVEGYRRRREESLTSLALRMADKVRQSGRSMTLEPMPPNERRIVHMILAEDSDVSTASNGEGERRKVIISPKRRGARGFSRG